MRRLLPVTALLVLTLVPLARADGPLPLTTVRLSGIDGSGTEPRITIAPDDVRYAITNISHSTGSGAVVFKSVDEGQTWQPTVSRPAGQTEPSIDVDIVAMATGRILGSELDFAGIDFPSSVTDNGGTTWQQSHGSNQLVDQDRQWFAAGPVDPATGKPTVFLLYHNLGSGEANHNMFVAKSTDGGLTFGAPVPVAQPGSDAYTDLQCADSGGPSDIAYDPVSKRVYVFFTTRAAPTAGGLDLGGCAAQPAEFNIVNGTRVWVASSATGDPGSWQDTLAVDRSPQGHVVSMQLAYGAIDNRGGVYVAFPESPQQYPEIGGAAVNLVYQHPDANGSLSPTAWSKPVTLVPPSDPAAGGANLVHLAVGDPGKVAVAYYRGVRVPGQGDTPVWYTHVVHSLDVLSASPTIVDQRVSDVPTYKWAAPDMMGICHHEPGIGGVLSGVDCDRSTDVWGIALDRGCRLSIVWPTAQPSSAGTTKGVPGDAPGTYVTTQNGGVSLCDSGNLPGGPSAAAFLPAKGAGASSGPAGCRDRIAPRSRVRGRIVASRRGVSFHGVSTDRGCANGRANAALAHGVRFVRVSISRRLASRKCRFLLGDGRFGPAVSCLRTTYLPAHGASRWSFALSRPLPRGRYVIWVRGIDRAANVERKDRRRNLARFVVR